MRKPDKRLAGKIEGPSPQDPAQCEKDGSKNVIRKLMQAEDALFFK
jgi:hypothetical protein